MFELLPQAYCLVNGIRDYSFGVGKDDPRTLGQRIRWARKQLDLTQVQLAAKAEIGQSALSSLETGATTWTRGGNLLRLALALNVEPYWLETGKGLIRDTDSNPPDFNFSDVISALTPDNRRRYLGMGRALLADQIEGADKPSVNQPFPGVPKGGRVKARSR
jgi:transcriptional regulator with XRE-family HTH domain